MLHINVTDMCYISEKIKIFPLPLPTFTARQHPTPPFPPFTNFIIYSLSSLSLLHSAVTSCPSYLAGKGEELQIQKTQTYTTVFYKRSISHFNIVWKKVFNFYSF